jgi:hypothetical protein
MQAASFDLPIEFTRRLARPLGGSFRCDPGHLRRTTGAPRLKGEVAGAAADDLDLLALDGDRFGSFHRVVWGLRRPGCCPQLGKFPRLGYTARPLQTHNF